MKKLKIWLWLCRFILSRIEDTGLSLKLANKLGFINSDNSPKMCWYCGNKEFKEVVTDSIESFVMEKNSICCKCNSICGYWVTGSWMP
jgi:hypothetical protein